MPISSFVRVWAHCLFHNHSKHCIHFKIHKASFIARASVDSGQVDSSLQGAETRGNIHRYFLVMIAHTPFRYLIQNNWKLISIFSKQHLIIFFTLKFVITFLFFSHEWDACDFCTHLCVLTERACVCVSEWMCVFQLNKNCFVWFVRHLLKYTQLTEI